MALVLARSWLYSAKTPAATGSDGIPRPRSRGFLLQFIRVPAVYSDRRQKSGRTRLAGAALALLFEVLLVLVVLSIGSSIMPEKGRGSGLVSVRFRAAPDQPKSRHAEEPPQQKAAPNPPDARSSPMPAQPATPAPRVIAPRPEPSPALIPLSPEQMASAEITPAPKMPPKSPPVPTPGGAMMGPPNTRPASRDSQRVSGSGPNGEPLYAASWYREPYEDELRGYLSTATGPGWGLIACRTAPEYRVEDCVALDEHPRGSNIARSVLAAAWQFQVRPPRVGGKLQVGEWVRIRISYDLQPR